MDADAVLVLSLLVLGYALISGTLACSPVTPAMAFAAAGLLAGPEVLGIVEVPIDGATFRHIAELALTVLLFTEASRLDLGALVRGRELPVRLLGIGLPLTMALGTLLALLLLGSLEFWEAAVLAVVLAPTDALHSGNLALPRLVRAPRDREPDLRSARGRGGGPDRLGRSSCERFVPGRPIIRNR
jgi:NhaP-type Na+/H+ or K+/H+ antiporter